MSRRGSWWMGWVVLLAGCGLKQEELATRLQSALCQHYMNCGYAASQESCEATLDGSSVKALKGVRKDALDKGTIRYNAQNAARCDELIRSASCDVGDPSNAFTECMRIYEGTFREGTLCTSDDECAPELFCMKFDEHQAPVCPPNCRPRTLEGQEAVTGVPCELCNVRRSGACLDLGRLGAPCDLDQTCKPELICDTHHTCAAAAHQGEPCDDRRCAGLLLCLDGMCSSPREVGEPCGALAPTYEIVTAFQVGLRCASNNTCAQPGPEGTPCQGDAECARGLRCDAPDSTSGRCVALAHSGDLCFAESCDSESTCDRKTQTCKALHAVGGPCTDRAQCESGLSCVNDTCMGPRTFDGCH